MQLLNYWPTYLQELLEFSEIANAEQPEFDLAWQMVRSLWREYFVSIMSVVGIERWERILNITPQPGLTEEERRFTIETRLLEKLPYSWRNLLAQLALLCGANGYTATLDPANYLIDIKVALESKHKRGDVEALLLRMAPANMIVLLDLLYNQYQTLKPYRHQQLKSSTYAQLKADKLEVI